MSETIAARVQLRRGTISQWTAANPTLLAGEAGYETDTGRLRIGDGTTAFLSLPYASISEADLTSLASASLDKATYDPQGIGDDPFARANHTGTQAASTIDGLEPVATSGDYGDLSNTPPELSEAQVTDPDDTTFGTVSGQRLAQSFDEREQQVGVGQTWQAPSRTHSTVYQNATSKPILISIYARSTVSTSRHIEVSPDGTSWITVGRTPLSGDHQSNISFIVPVGWRYRIDGAVQTDTNLIWAELR